MRRRLRWHFISSASSRSASVCVSSVDTSSSPSCWIWLRTAADSPRYASLRRSLQWRSDGGAGGRTGRHLLGAAKGRKRRKFKKNARENSDCKFHMCLRARKTKRCGQRVVHGWVLTRILMLLLTLRETYALNRLSSFQNLRRKGGKFDHRPGRPKVLLRHWATLP